MVVDAARGPVRYEHDALGNLAAATYEDGRVDLRMPDAVGNLFRTQDRTDRKYGPAGQLLESREPDGRVVTYEYDPEGNLVKKTEVDAAPQLARVWTYHWNGAGMLTKVVRPDGETVTFTYDALARRFSKTYRARTTKWIWDGNLPLHEWVEGRPAAISPAHHGALGDVAVLDELAARRRRYERAARPAQGPPDGFLHCASTRDPLRPGLEHRRYRARHRRKSDHLALRSRELRPHGQARRRCPLRDRHRPPRHAHRDVRRRRRRGLVRHHRRLRRPAQPHRHPHACPFRWPGQYEDAETGLYYNRFRYYDASQGHYLSPDPLGLLGGPVLAGYVSDPLTQTDPFGLITILDAIRDQSPKSIPNTATVHGPTIKSGGGLPYHHTEWRWREGGYKWSARFHGPTAGAIAAGDRRAVWIITRTLPGHGAIPPVSEVLTVHGTWVPLSQHASGATGKDTHLSSCRG